GKANKEIEEIAAFLIAHGYDQYKVQQFFAPLARGVDVIDQAQHSREFFAYLDANNHLVNEGIVASMALLQELSNELAHDGAPMFRVRSPFGTYVGFQPSIPGVELVGTRLIGNVALKGLDNIDVAELVPFGPGEAEEVMPIESPDSFITILRQHFNARREASSGSWMAAQTFDTTTTERVIESEIVICVKTDSSDLEDEVLIGEWDPRSDDVHRPLRLPRGDFQRLFSLKGELTAETLAGKKDSVRQMYERLSLKTLAPALALSPYRDGGDYDAYILGDVVEKL
ncbi:MAG: hypothetical protein ACLGH0_13865, partial [Thermoanaerobaculia bacterium]